MYFCFAMQVAGSRERVGTSNIDMTQLKFDLSLFKSLQCLEVRLYRRKVTRSSIWSYQGFLEKYTGNVRKEIPKDNHVCVQINTTILMEWQMFKVIIMRTVIKHAFYLSTDFQTICSLCFFPMSRLIFRIMTLTSCRFGFEFGFRLAKSLMLQNFCMHNRLNSVNFMLPNFHLLCMEWISYC